LSGVIKVGFIICKLEPCEVPDGKLQDILQFYTL